MRAPLVVLGGLAVGALAVPEFHTAETVQPNQMEFLRSQLRQLDFSAPFCERVQTPEGKRELIAYAQMDIPLQKGVEVRINYVEDAEAADVTVYPTDRGGYHEVTVEVQTAAGDGMTGELAMRDLDDRTLAAALWKKTLHQLCQAYRDAAAFPDPERAMLGPRLIEWETATEIGYWGGARVGRFFAASRVVLTRGKDRIDISMWPLPGAGGFFHSELGIDGMSGNITDPENLWASVQSAFEMQDDGVDQRLEAAARPYALTTPRLNMPSSITGPGKEERQERKRAASPLSRNVKAPRPDVPVKSQMIG